MRIPVSLTPAASTEREVRGHGADPGGDLREAVAPLLDRLQGGAVLLGVEEELALPDQAAVPVQAVQQVEEAHDLLHAVGLAGLLPVAEGGVRDPQLRGAGRRAPRRRSNSLRGTRV